MQPHRKCLLIIDNMPKDQGLEDYFNQFDYSIIQYSALEQIPSGIKPDAILVNWQLFKQNSITIDNLYRQYLVPLLIISDKANESACVSMLEAGADDFLIKPLHPRELHARISAISRRVQRAAAGEQEQTREVLFFANWRLYPSSRQVFCENNKELQLSAGEYDLLLAFLRQPQSVLSRDFLLQITKHSDLTPFDRRIDVQISRLRQKIETDVRKPALIKTIRNSGYLFTAPVLSIRETIEGK